jgi:hypothetical protein
MAIIVTSSFAAQQLLRFSKGDAAIPVVQLQDADLSAGLRDDSGAIQQKAARI